MTSTWQVSQAAAVTALALKQFLDAEATDEHDMNEVCTCDALHELRCPCHGRQPRRLPNGWKLSLRPLTNGGRQRALEFRAQLQ